MQRIFTDRKAVLFASVIPPLPRNGITLSFFGMKNDIFAKGIDKSKKN